MQGRGASTCPSDHECTEVVAWKVRIQKIVRHLEDWCCQTGLNCRPLHYQWSALPLSYGSMPEDLTESFKRPYTARRSLPQAVKRRKRSGAVKDRPQARVLCRCLLPMAVAPALGPIQEPRL